MRTEVTDNTFKAIVHMMNGATGCYTVGRGMDWGKRGFITFGTMKGLVDDGVFVASGPSFDPMVLGQEITLSDEVMKVDWSKIKTCDGFECGRRKSCLRHVLYAKGQRISKVQAKRACDQFLNLFGKAEVEA